MILRCSFRWGLQNRQLPYRPDAQDDQSQHLFIFSVTARPLIPTRLKTVSTTLANKADLPVLQIQTAVFAIAHGTIVSIGR